MSVYRDVKDIQENPAFSGGDNILINLLRRWQDVMEIEIFTWDGGEYFLKSLFGIERVRYNIVFGFRRRYHFVTLFLIRAFKAIKWTLQNQKNNADFVYSPSDFIPDSLPAFILKLKNPKIKWIASFYLFFPNPFSSINPYKGERRLLGLFQYLIQIPSKYLIKWFADIVFVTSEPDKIFFITRKRVAEKVVVIKGGVNTADFDRIDKQIVRYDGVFMGRFHPQKGLIELIHIWKLVTEKFPHSKLAIIGQGEATSQEKNLKSEIHSLISKYDLTSNVELLGFLAGEKKIKVLKSSRVFLHPAIYDSGGMAAAEAMACGLPGVSFDLEALKTYYPKGMLKTNCFDVQEFAKNIMKLLQNNELYNKLSKEALELVKAEWDWDRRSKVIYDSLIRSVIKK